LKKQEKHISVDDVMAALSKVQDPELHKDLVTLGMVKDVSVQGGLVSFSVVLTTPACPLRAHIEQEARKAVEALPGVTEVKVEMQSSVPKGMREGPHGLANIRNSIAVGSGKGGVGKTTVAVNMAVALSKAGACVGLLDADIYGPNVPIMMGLQRLPPPREGKLIPAEAFGVKVISLGFLVEPGQPVIWRGPMLHSVIGQFIRDVEWGDLDYLVVDLPPGTGDAALSLAQTIPLSGAIIVTLPQQVSLDDAFRGIEMFRALGVPVLGLVENMSFLELPDGQHMPLFGQGGGAQLAKRANVPLLGSIPIDAHIPPGGDSGVPIVVSHPESAAAQVLSSMTERLAGMMSVEALRPKPESKTAKA
jgi:ATP-binding protein involved in chromosome partitioning